MHSSLFYVITCGLEPAWVTSFVILHGIVAYSEVAISGILELRIGNGSALIYEEGIGVGTFGYVTISS